MSVSGNIVHLRKHYDLTQNELSERTGINRSVLNRIEKGTRPVRDDELKIFADCFNVSADYLLGRDMTKAPALSAEQVALLKGFDSLNSDGQRDILGYLDFLKYKYARETTGSNIKNNFVAYGGQNSVNQL